MRLKTDELRWWLSGIGFEDALTIEQLSSQERDITERELLIPVILPTILAYVVIVPACLSVHPSEPPYDPVLNRIKQQIKTEQSNHSLNQLRNKLGSGDEEDRLQAIVELTSIGTEEALAATSMAIADRSEKIRAAVLTTLGMLDDPRYTALIIERLQKDKSSFVRRSAAYALGAHKSAQRDSALLSALKDKDGWVRAAAATGLGDHPFPGSVRDLIFALSDVHDFVRAPAARALGKNGPAAEAAITALIRLLENDPEIEVRREAATSLGLISSRSALPALEKARQSPDPFLSEAAREAIERIRQGSQGTQPPRRQGSSAASA